MAEPKPNYGILVVGYDPTHHPDTAQRIDEVVEAFKRTLPVVYITHEGEKQDGIPEGVIALEYRTTGYGESTIHWRTPDKDNFRRNRFQGHLFEDEGVDRLLVMGTSEEITDEMYRTHYHKITSPDLIVVGPEALVNTTLLDNYQDVMRELRGE